MTTNALRYFTTMPIVPNGARRNFQIYRRDGEPAYIMSVGPNTTGILVPDGCAAAEMITIELNA
jgi:hypothetical protein